MRSPRVSLRLALAAPAVVVLASGTDLADPPNRDTHTAARPTGQAHIRLLGVNDFHGTLESPGAQRRGRDGRSVPLGGAAVLESHLDRAAAAAPGRTIRVHAGDMVGATPLVSSHFHDEPAVRAMNLMEFDVGTVGNHEFDEGATEMLRLLRGGRRRGRAALKRDARGRLVNTSSPSFPGANFPYVAANTVDRRGRLLLTPYRIVKRAGVKVGFIGVTTDTTPRYLLARHSRPLRFLDISSAVNRWVPKLRGAGVRAIVVLAHSGAAPVRGPEGARGEIVAEARQMSDDVDVVVAGHTHTELNVRVGGKLVVEALSYGTAFDRVDLKVDRRSGEVVRKSATVPRTWADEVEPDPSTEALVRRYANLVAPLARRGLGRASRYISRPAPGAGGRGAGLAELAAHAQREAAGADIAFLNPGNLRSDLPAGPVTYADLFAVQRYEHVILRMEMKGADVEAVLRQQYEAGAPVRLHVSGLRWTEDSGSVTNIRTADGSPLDPSATYTVAANELLATGERFSVLRDRGRAKRPVGTDLDALARKIERLRSPLH
jgi:5'-nucleotidase